jgi:hypothetical protein
MHISPHASTAVRVRLKKQEQLGQSLVLGLRRSKQDAAKKPQGKPTAFTCYQQQLWEGRQICCRTTPAEAVAETAGEVEKVTPLHGLNNYKDAKH